MVMSDKKYSEDSVEELTKRIKELKKSLKRDLTKDELRKIQNELGLGEMLLLTKDEAENLSAEEYFKKYRNHGESSYNEGSGAQRLSREDSINKDKELKNKREIGK